VDGVEADAVASAQQLAGCPSRRPHAAMALIQSAVECRRQTPRSTHTARDLAQISSIWTSRTEAERTLWVRGVAGRPLQSEPRGNGPGRLSGQAPPMSASGEHRECFGRPIRFKGAGPVLRAQAIWRDVVWPKAAGPLRRGPTEKQTLLPRSNQVSPLLSAPSCGRHLIRSFQPAVTRR
jgi:hypothetical protein